LRKFHGGVRHVGRRPGGGRIELPADEMACAAPEEAEAVEPTAGSVLSQQKQLAIVKDLQRKMERAIQSEDFEKAARYRDQINELKQRLQT
jgi:excinuclease UvrABC nuclease subunit